ncbi:hypothetical protein HZZ13_00460 [Bradyrhizobium sp. CNPSo 4010]|uniref:Uncharacterized protein n=1 Tax=Bradyrhizobium agreste TaxID=2751811 RepID=A0ABS0PGH4_9BRAD|nr:hypothetical protein [Bradyrhizobium agreste]MBH5396297.1 hypothetical protein [Bradyrhizobium agreste]
MKFVVVSGAPAIALPSYARLEIDERAPLEFQEYNRSHRACDKDVGICLAQVAIKKIIVEGKRVYRAVGNSTAYIQLGINSPPVLSDRRQRTFGRCLYHHG